MSTTLIPIDIALASVPLHGVEFVCDEKFMRFFLLHPTQHLNKNYVLHVYVYIVVVGAPCARNASISWFIFSQRTCFTLMSVCVGATVMVNVNIAHTYFYPLTNNAVQCIWSRNVINATWKTWMSVMERFVSLSKNRSLFSSSFLACRSWST